MCPTKPDGIPSEQRLVLVNARGKRFEEFLNQFQPPERRLQRQPPDAEITGHHALAGDGLKDVENLLALPEAVEENRHGTQVDGVRAEPDQVALDARKLRQKHANPLGAPGDFQIQQLLGGQAESQVIGQRRQVVNPVGERDALGVSLALKGFFKASVEIANVVNGAHHGFTIELQH